MSLEFTASCHLPMPSASSLPEYDSWRIWAENDELWGEEQDQCYPLLRGREWMLNIGPHLSHCKDISPSTESWLTSLHKHVLSALVWLLQRFIGYCTVTHTSSISRHLLHRSGTNSLERTKKLCPLPCPKLKGKWEQGIEVLVCCTTKKKANPITQAA